MLLIFLVSLLLSLNRLVNAEKVSLYCKQCLMKRWIVSFTGIRKTFQSATVSYTCQLLTLLSLCVLFRYKAKHFVIVFICKRKPEIYYDMCKVNHYNQPCISISVHVVYFLAKASIFLLALLKFAILPYNKLKLIKRTNNKENQINAITNNEEKSLCFCVTMFTFYGWK